MKYQGIELKEFTSDKPVVFDPPKEVAVWDYERDTPFRGNMYAYLPESDYPVKCTDVEWLHCAEILGLPKPRRATNRELAMWLALGNGEKKRLDEYEKEGIVFASIEFTYELGDADRPVDECYFIRRWKETEWHEPTADYMGLKD